MSDSGRQRTPVSPGDVVAGKYRVERVLGAGGMGVVVAATHLELGQPVALKFIQPSAVSNNGSLERFLREARAAARLRSEHVCRVLDVGRDGERPYMVLELLEGMDLAKLARHAAPLPVADAVEYVLQACDALVEAHGLGIVHRDLKPQNVFVTRRVNGTPLVKVLDFGIAKSVGAAAAGQMALTDSSAIIGSPLYMAPEQMRAPKTVDVRIDIWALGVILYELLGGQLPFDGETVTEVCIKVVNEEPTRLLDLRPALDRKLVDVVMRCLEKDPEDRWQNVAQLAVELEPFSRSGRQGSFTRPWRSFDDTSDSQDVLPRVVLSTPGMLPTADDTGPSTALTMPSGPQPEVALPASRRPGQTAMLAATTPMPGDLAVPSRAGRVSLSDASPPLASTDTTWGEGTARQPAQPKAGLGRGAIVAIVGALAVAAGVGVVVGMRGRAPAAPAATETRASATDDGPPAATTVLAARPVGTPLSPNGAPPVASAAEAAPVAPLASATPVTAARPTRGTRPAESGRGAPTASAPKLAEPAPKPADPAPKPTEPAPKPTEPAPNGAPILR